VLLEIYEGAEEGTTLGFMDGNMVGDTDGAMLGEIEGMMIDGIGVGLLVGKIFGRRVGI